MNGGTFKIPSYWYDLFKGLEDWEVGVIFRYVLAIHNSLSTGEPSHFVELINETTNVIKKLISEESHRVCDICKADVEYQAKHKRAYRKPEDVVAIRNSKEYREWRTAVYERDKYTCQNCGRVGGKINAHHIKPFSRFPELRLDVNNGVTLCKECHKLAHERGFRNA
jgi:5-methylcytosine-specific restriction endonuclease McrA